MAMTMEFRSYRERLLFFLYDWGTYSLFIVLVLAFYTTVFAGVVVLLYAIFWLIRRYKESRLFVTSIEVNDLHVKIEYFWFNSGPNQLDLAVSQARVKWYRNTVGVVSGDKLVFLVKGKPVLIQYYCGGWTGEKLEETFNALKPILNKNQYR